MWDEILKIKSDTKALREFGFVMAAFFGIIGVIAAFRGKPHYIHLLSVGAAFGLAAILLPRILLPLQKTWMAFSIVIGFFMSRHLADPHTRAIPGPHAAVDTAGGVPGRI